MNPYFRLLSRELALVGNSVGAEAVEAVRLNRLFFSGDHWQDGAGWIGPIPSMNDATYLDVRAEIKRAFCSRNVISEIVLNQRDGVLGSEPAWSFARVDEVTQEAPLSQSEAALLDEVNNVATAWWDERGMTQLLKDAHDAAALGERVWFRLYIPRGRLKQNSDGSYSMPVGDFPTQMERVFVQKCDNGQAGPLLDAESQISGASYLEDRGARAGAWLELVFPEADSQERVQTVIRVLELVDEGERESVYTYDLGGRLTMAPLRVPVLVSQQVRENQMSINLQKTLQNRNSIAGGFLERIITDGMPPGQYVDDPDNPGRQIYKVKPFKVGAGTINFIGPSVDGQGDKTRYGSPNVHFRDPVPPSTFIEAKRDFYQDTLEEVGQTHTLTNGDASASGEARKQARQTFKKRLDGVKSAIDPVGRWMLETAVLMALVFANRREEGEMLRCDFGCIVDTGPRTADERREDDEAVKNGTLSVETKMSRDGIEDPDAEMGRIQQEAAKSRGARLQMAQTAQALTAAGASIGGAARVAGFDETEAAILEQTDFVPENGGGGAGG